jgi:release factor glutamine methyltransferase
MELTTRGALLAEAIARLKAAGNVTASLDARLLLCAALRVEATALYAAPEASVGGEEASRFRALLERRLTGESVARILGRREFWSLEFRLGPDTLEPRPDSETLVEAALAAWAGRPTRPACILDLGTGTGCLLLALLGEWKSAFGVGVDRAFGAAQVAQENARRLGFGARAAFVVGDWGAALRGSFDLVVSNPPYIESDAIAGLDETVRGFDPRRALDGGATGLDAYRVLVPQAADLLTPGGWLVLEIGAAQASAVGDIAAAAGLTSLSVRHDLGRRPRCVLAQKPH